MANIRRLPGGIPIPLVVIGLPVLGMIYVGLWVHLSGSSRPPAGATPVRSADLVLQDEADGGVAVLQAGDGRLVDRVQPNTGAFLRVMLAGLVRERRREGVGNPDVPFHLTRWSDGRLTIDDLATGKPIELNAFGPDNAGVFARLLDLSRPPARPAQEPPPR